MRAYIVEDSSVIRVNLKEALHENTPVEVIGCAEDEQAAVQWLLNPQNGCDLVILDIFLKSGSGLGVLKQIANRAPPVRRVVLSNHATPEVRAKCAELGADRVFDKSNEIDEMLGYFNRLEPRGETDYSIPSSL